MARLHPLWRRNGRRAHGPLCVWGVGPWRWQVLFKMDKDGYVDDVALARLARSDRLNLTTFTPHKFQQLCVLSGCDYLPSLRGIGPLKAAAALSRHRDAMHVRTAYAHSCPCLRGTAHTASACSAPRPPWPCPAHAHLGTLGGGECRR
jgi:hypothetical protein